MITRLVSANSSYLHYTTEAVRKPMKTTDLTYVIETNLITYSCIVVHLTKNEIINVRKCCGV